MSVPVFDFSGVQVVPPWSIYLLIVLPLTGTVLLVYYLWIQFFNPIGNRQYYEV